MREIVFDTETTGLDPKTGDRMVEIGCIELVNRVPTGRTFHAYYNPERPMPVEAERVHGLGDSFLFDKPRFHESVLELLDFLEDAPLVAHNAQFDFSFLNFELGICGHPGVSLDRMVDTLTIARRRSRWPRSGRASANSARLAPIRRAPRNWPGTKLSCNR